MKLILGLVFSFILNSSYVLGSTLHEGWYEVFLDGKKIGFMAERFEFTSDKFKAVTYMKIKNAGVTSIESLKAFSKNDLSPLNYAYTLKDGDTVKTIDATFTGSKMNLKINDGKKTKKETKVLKKGTFLSTFLLYMIMSKKDGLTTGKDYSYFAVAEEEGKAYAGNAKVTSLDKVKGKEAYKVLNKFKGDSFFSWVTSKGEFLLTRNPDKNLELRIADNMKTATENLGANLEDLKLLFGKLPGESGGEADGKADEKAAGKPENKAESKSEGKAAKEEGKQAQ
jgi:uncharacterized protein Veg